MSRRHAFSTAFATPPPVPILDFEHVAASERPVPHGADRREHARLSVADFSARFKYGEAVTLVDVSAGGALLETTRVLRPDTDLVLEILDTRTQNVARVISRVLRSQVAGIDGAIRYRGACKFKRPLAHPTLVAQPAALLQRTDPRDFLKLETALKTIVEGYFRRPGVSRGAGRWRDASALLDALIRLRAAAERRGDANNRQLVALLDAIIPALTQQGSPEAIIRDVQALLARQLPLLAIHPDGPAAYIPHDREVVTLGIAAESGEPRVAVTAEFAAGFALDESQFRLLKAGAYLVALVGRWRAPVDDPLVDDRPNAAAHVAPKSLAGTHEAADSCRTDYALPDAAGRPEPVCGDGDRACSGEEMDAGGGDDDQADATLEDVEAGSTPGESDGRLPAGWRRVVVRFVDGQLLRGYASDFQPERAHLLLAPRVNCQSTERLLVPLPRVKAVFFVKSLEGDPNRVDDQRFDRTAGARKVEVTFRDGEVMRGSTVSYKPNSRGFFLKPPNSRSNNTRIYVVSAAVRQMRFV